MCHEPRPTIEKNPCIVVSSSIAWILHLNFTLLCTISDDKFTEGQNINIFKFYFTILFFKKWLPYICNP
jgi:hypothetical protein